MRKLSSLPLSLFRNQVKTSIFGIEHSWANETCILYIAYPRRGSVVELLSIALEAGIRVLGSVWKTRRTETNRKRMHKPYTLRIGTLYSVEAKLRHAHVRTSRSSPFAQRSRA